MPKGKDHRFEVKILQKSREDKNAGGEITNASYEPLKEVITPMGIYVVAIPNAEFIVELRSDDPYVYGAKLWIDEQEIYYKKTFKSRGFFMGFKLGEGRFNAFKFAPPIYETKEKAPVNLTKSEIRVEFYKCSERLVSNQNILNKSVRRAHDEYKPGIVKDNKKFFRKSLTVQPGEVLFKPGLDKHTLLKKLMDQKSKKFKENVINYNAVLDSITFHYGDFNSLLVQGVLSLANYDHLNVVPLDEVRKRPKIIERMLMTMIRKHESSKGLSPEQIEAEFKKTFRVTFEELEVGPLVTFISHRHDLFQLDDKNHLKTSEKAKNIYLDLRDIDPDNGIVPEKYYKTGLEIEMKHRKKDMDEPAFLSRYKNKSCIPTKDANGNARQPIIIDLTNE